MKEAKVGSEALRVDRPRREVEDDEIDLMELARALWRGKWTIALTAFLAVVLGGYYAFGIADPQYKSSAQLTLEMRTKQVVDIESVVSGVSTDQAALNTEIEIILSRRVLGSLVDKLNLIEDAEFNSALKPPSYLARAKETIESLISADEAQEIDRQPKSPRDRTIGALRSALSASVQRDTYVFAISATTGEPAKSAQIVNALADIYIDEQIAVKFEATEKAVAWLSSRVTELEEELRVKEDTLKTATAETDMISAEALEGLNLQAKDLRDRLQEMRADVERVGAELKSLEELKSANNRADAVTVTGDPTLRRLLSSIEDGDLEAADLFDQRLSALIERGQAEMSRLNSQVLALSSSYQNLQERIERQSEDLARIQQMQREVETTRTLYETFLTRLKETSVQRGLQQADSRILSDAIPGEQVAPRPALILALSMVLGLMVGAGTVLAKTFLHSVFRTPEDLEQATGIPVLGQIPKIPFKGREHLIGYLSDKPTSAASEAIRNLRTSVLLSDIDNPPQVIVSTSSVPGEGKTTASIALVQNLAGLGKKVLLVEGDIRRRTFSAYFDAQPKGGVIAALSGDTPLNEVVFHDDRLGADILMGEKSRVNAADLFSSERFRGFMADARDAYDFIIIDTPPVLVVPDARVIGQHADAILFSVAWDETHKSQVSAALREFDSVNLRITGLILAQIDPKGMRRYGYGGKYGAYAGYGKGYYDAI